MIESDSEMTDNLLQNGDSGMTDSENIISRSAERLSEVTDQERQMVPSWTGPLPSPTALEEIVNQLRIVFFPEFFDQLRGCRSMTRARLTVSVDRLYRLLLTEISKCLAATDPSGGRRSSPASYICPEEPEEIRREAQRKALAIIDNLPRLKHLIYTDVQAIFDNDPATEDYGEIILSYPVVQAMVHHRLAHEMVKLNIPVLPRILSELAHSKTGIDINPGATIGEYFAIDHGTGVVIGETCIIGNHVTIYQGVTLGARNFTLNDEGRPVNLPRHPILEDHVTVYANSTILGRVTIGHDTVIGGNVWLTESVAPYSRVTQPPFSSSNRITTADPNKKEKRNPA